MPASPTTDKRSTIVLPSVTVMSASAGAGKTHALAHRYVQLLLSETVPHNAPQNILAITFTNNAAAEMKQRILKVLKRAALGDGETLAELATLVPLAQSDLRAKAARLVDELFSNYSDFNVKTVDSFMSTIFTSSSIEYGVNPDFEIQFSVDRIFDRAFELFSREIREGSDHARVVGEMMGFLSENRKSEEPFLWNAYGNLRRRVQEVYHMIASRTKPLRLRRTDNEGPLLRKKIAEQAAQLQALVTKSALPMNHLLAADLGLIRAGNLQALVERTLKTTSVNKPKNKAERAAYDAWFPQIDTALGQLNDLLRQYFVYYVESYYLPYAEVYRMMQQAIGRVKEQYGQIFIDDVNRTLAEHLNVEAVPEIYFKIGETISHYLIDEFQDTSQIQWRNLFPLIEESLSTGGSLFVVGDTKQSIYGFRDADWTIMKSLMEENLFPSAHHDVQTLGLNYRSDEQLIAYTKEMFHAVIPGHGLQRAADASGLSSYVQEPTEGHRGRGYVRVDLFQDDEDDPPERAKIIAVVEECRSRGYEYKDIAILTPANKNVVKVSGWLNEKGIPIVSHSTLDVRRRKSAGECIALLRFLDTPVDDLSFTTFVLGDLFAACADTHRLGITRKEVERLILDHRRTGAAPLYVGFRNRFAKIWDVYFEHLFNVVGYLPLYDLLTEAYKIFDVFGTMPEEEASLVKLLEVIKSFEEEGTNAIKNFLEFAGDESEEEVWKIDVPGGVEALSVMTVHKAKGMEFPVVIVLLYDQRPRGKSYVIREDDDSVTILRANKKIAEHVESLNELLEAEQFRESVDALNKLYVALTRAKNEMYVVGVFKKTPEVPTKFLTPATLGALPEKTGTPDRDRHENVVAPQHHRTRTPLPIQEYGPLAAAELKRGDAIHRVLSLVEYLEGGVREHVDEAARRAEEEWDETLDRDEVVLTVCSALESDLREFFIRSKGRSILREQELTNASGALYRADRIVLDPGAATVIDFKTGGDEHEPEYLVQVRNYMAMMKEIYPEREVRGVIAYLDMRKVRTIS